MLKFEKLVSPSNVEFPLKGLASHSVIVYKENLYVFCGQTSNKYILSCVLQYNFQNQTWKPLKLSSFTPPPSRCHTSVLYENNAYLFGGDNVQESSNEIFSFDLENLKWKFLNLQENIKPKGRRGHVACTYKDKMFIFGGYYKDNEQLNDTWYFDFQKKNWIEIHTNIKPCKRRYSTLTKYNDSLLLFCGHDGVSRLNDIWEFNCLNFRWREIKTHGKIPSLRSSCSSVILGDSCYIFGGMDGEKKNDLYELDLHSKEWKEMDVYYKASIPPARYWHVGFLHNDELYIHGGWVQPDKEDCYDDFYKIKLLKKNNNTQKILHQNLQSKNLFDCVFVWNQK